jgi:hypothetical protein
MTNRTGKVVSFYFRPRDIAALRLLAEWRYPNITYNRSPALRDAVYEALLNDAVNLHDMTADDLKRELDKTEEITE